MNLYTFIRSGLLKEVATALIIASCGGYAQTDSVFSGTCSNGAQSKDPKYCSLFVHYNNDPDADLDTRIADALNINSASQTRSIALIIAVDRYPKIPGHDIPAAKVDGDRLTDFLIKVQKFD